MEQYDSNGSANHHAARVLSKVTRQILYSHGQIEIFSNPWVLNIKASIVKRVRHCVVSRLATPNC